MCRARDHAAISFPRQLPRLVSGASLVRGRAPPPRPLAPGRPSPRRGLPAVPSRPIGPVPAAAPWSDTDGDAPEVRGRPLALPGHQGGAPARAAAAEDVLVGSAGLLRGAPSRPYLRPQAWRPCWADGRRRAHRVNDRAPPAPRPPRQRCAYYRSSTSATCDPLRAAPRGGSGLTRFAYSRSDSLASSVGSPSMIRETLCFYSARGKNTLGTLLKESTTTETLSIAPSVRTRVM